MRRRLARAALCAVAIGYVGALVAVPAITLRFEPVTRAAFAFGRR